MAQQHPRRHRRMAGEAGRSSHVDVARDQDFDAGFGAGMLDLMNGVGFARRSRRRALVRPVLGTMQQSEPASPTSELYPQDEQSTTYNELAYWREIADSITSQLASLHARGPFDDRTQLSMIARGSSHPGAYAWRAPED